MTKHPFLYIKNNWERTDSIGFFIALSLSMTIFIRCLNFFKTPNLNKIIVFFALFIFLYLLTIFYISPILEYFREHKKILLLFLLSSVTLVSLIFLIFPYKTAPFPTTHHLSITVPSDSSTVVLEKLTGPDGKPIPLGEILSDQQIIDDDIYVKPGETFQFSSEMTGGLSFRATAINNKAEVNISWDDQKETIPLGAGDSRYFQTDPSSWGKPSKTLQYFMFCVVANEWISFILFSLFLGGFLYIEFVDSNQDYLVHMPELCSYLKIYLILNTILLVLAVLERFFPINRQTYNLYLLMPGLIFLIIKISYRYLRLIPLIILFIGIVLNPVLQLRLPHFNRLRIKHLKDQSLNNLTQIASPNEPTLLSIGFYKELREAELIMTADSFLAESNNLERLKRINILEEVHFCDYQSELTYEHFNAFSKQPDWKTWKGIEKTYYFYNGNDLISSPIAVFYYGDHIFLIPIQYTENLGLPYDFVLD